MGYNLFRAAAAGVLTLALGAQANAQKILTYERGEGDVSCTMEPYASRVTCIDAPWWRNPAAPRKAYASATEGDKLIWFAEGKDRYYVVDELTKRQRKSRNPRYVLPTDRKAVGAMIRHKGMLRETGAKIN